LTRSNCTINPQQRQRSFCTNPVSLDVKAGKVSYNGITLGVDPVLAKSVTAQGCLIVPY
jgi:hypothetical protein